MKKSKTFLILIGLIVILSIGLMAADDDPSVAEPAAEAAPAAAEEESESDKQTDPADVSNREKVESSPEDNEEIKVDAETTAAPVVETDVAAVTDEPTTEKEVAAVTDEPTTEKNVETGDEADDRKSLNETISVDNETEIDKDEGNKTEDDIEVTFGMFPGLRMDEKANITGTKKTVEAVNDDDKDDKDDKDDDDKTTTNEPVKTNSTTKNKTSDENSAAFEIFSNSIFFFGFFFHVFMSGFL